MAVLQVFRAINVVDTNINRSKEWTTLDQIGWAGERCGWGCGRAVPSRGNTCAGYNSPVLKPGAPFATLQPKIELKKYTLTLQPDYDLSCDTDTASIKIERS